MTKRSERVIDYSVYLNATDYLGTATATLPEITYLVDTVKGGGIAGEMAAPSPGHTGAMSLALKWRTIEKAAAALLAPKVHTLDLRASIQTFDTATSEYREVPFKVTVRARPLGLTLGNLDTAAVMDTTNNFSVNYLKVSLDGIEVLEIDKYNYIHKVNDVDYLATTKANLGL